MYFFQGLAMPHVSQQLVLLSRPAHHLFNLGLESTVVSTLVRSPHSAIQKGLATPCFLLLGFCSPLVDRLVISFNWFLSRQPH